MLSLLMKCFTFLNKTENLPLCLCFLVSVIKPFVATSVVHSTFTHFILFLNVSFSLDSLDTIDIGFVHGRSGFMDLQFLKRLRFVMMKII